MEKDQSSAIRHETKRDDSQAKSSAAAAEPEEIPPRPARPPPGMSALKKDTTSTRPKSAPPNVVKKVRVEEPMAEATQSMSVAKSSGAQPETAAAQPPPVPAAQVSETPQWTRTRTASEPGTELTPTEEAITPADEARKNVHMNI